MADLQDPQSLDNRKLSAIARNPSHPMHTHAKSELDRRKVKKSELGEMNEDGHTDVPSAIRGCKTTMEDAMQILKKLQSMNGEDSLPSWWTNKLAVASNSMNKLRDYIITPSNMEEKTLTPAEIRKRDKIAKAIKKDDPDMPMDKKMAIATATAKRVAEAADDFKPHMMYDPKTGKEYKANKPEDHERMAKMGYSHDKPKVNEVSSKTLSNYMRKSPADAGKPRQSTRTQDKRIGGQKMADDKLRKMDGKGSAAKVAATNEVLDTPKAMQSYKDKAKYSKDKATNSAVANILRKGDHTDDLKTRAKRVKGLGMADRNATNKTAKALRKEESVNELSKDTMQSYWNKTKGDDAFSGSRKANNRLKGAINVTTKLDRLKKMVNKNKE